MPRTIGDLISSGVEQAALEGQGGGMMAFLMAMKGVQGIAETLQNMEAEKRVNKKWEWEQEDREVEVMQREASKKEIERQNLVRDVLAGNGGGKKLDPRGKAAVAAARQDAGELGVPGIKALVNKLVIDSGGKKDLSAAGFAVAKDFIKTELERVLSNIELDNVGDPKTIIEEKNAAIKDLWTHNKESMRGILTDATFTKERTPFDSSVYDAIRSDKKGMFADVMGTAKVISESKKASPEQKENAATTWAMLKDEQTGSARKFLNDKDIIDKLPFRENDDGSLTWSYNGKERTQKEIEEVFSNPVNRQRFARKVALGEKEPKVNKKTPSQEAAMGIENAMVEGVDNAVEAVAPYLEEANKQTDATRRWEQLKGFFSKTIPGMVNDTKKLYGVIEENPITALLSVGESFDKTLGKAKAPGLSNYLGKTGRQVDQESPGTSGWSLDAQHTDVEPRAELSGTYPALPTNPFEAPGMQPSIAQDPDGLMKLLSMMNAGTLRGRVAPELPSGPANAAMNPTQNQLLFNRQAPSIANDPNGMMLLLKMLMQAQSNMPAPAPKSATKFGKDDQELQNQFKALLQTQGFKSKPKSWDDRAWQPK